MATTFRFSAFKFALPYELVFLRQLAFTNITKANQAYWKMYSVFGSRNLIAKKLRIIAVLLYLKMIQESEIFSIAAWY